MFERVKKKALESLVEGVLERELEEKLFAQVGQEIESGLRRDGLWAKALAISDGQEARAKAEYIKLRVQSLRDEKVLESLASVEDAYKAAEMTEAENQKFTSNVAKFFSGLDFNLTYREHEWFVVGTKGRFFKFKSKERVELLLLTIQDLSKKGYVVRIEEKIGLLDSKLVWSVTRNAGNRRAFIATSLNDLVLKTEAISQRS